jgi:hypothetical protein
MIVAIHQPNFLPWLGYVAKMARADRFVFLDSVPFAKGSYTNRVRIKTAAGARWLTVPVKTHGKLGQAVCDVRCSEGGKWQRKFVQVLKTHYGGCPYFQPQADRLFDIVSGAGDSIAEMNVQLILHIAGQLDIRTPAVRSSQMAARGAASDLLIALCKELGADTYLSGSGGANYQDEAAFAAAGIQIIYNNYHHPIYPQAFGEFVPGMSVIDLLFNAGPDSRRILLE